jgi:hypothetical protein
MSINSILLRSSIRGEIQCIICRSSWGNDNWRYWSFEKYANNARGLAVLFLFLEYTLHTCTKMIDEGLPLALASDFNQGLPIRKYEFCCCKRLH